MKGDQNNAHKPHGWGTVLFSFWVYYFRRLFLGLWPGLKRFLSRMRCASQEMKIWIVAVQQLITQSAAATASMFVLPARESSVGSVQQRDFYHHQTQRRNGIIEQLNLTWEKPLLVFNNKKNTIFSTNYDAQNTHKPMPEIKTGVQLQQEHL